MATVIAECVILFVGDDNRDQKIAPVAVAAMMTGGADQFHGDASLDRLHDGVVEAMQIVGEHTDNGLLIGAHA